SPRVELRQPADARLVDGVLGELVGVVRWEDVSHLEAGADSRRPLADSARHQLERLETPPGRAHPKVGHAANKLDERVGVSLLAGDEVVKRSVADPEVWG